MKWERLAAIIAVIAFLFTVGGVVYARGALDASIRSIETKETADVAANDSAHVEFRAAENEVTKLTVKIEGLEKSMDELRGDVKELLKRVPK
jgi:hypothetical protein